MLEREAKQFTKKMEQVDANIKSQRESQYKVGWFVCSANLLMCKSYLLASPFL